MTGQLIVNESDAVISLRHLLQFGVQESPHLLAVKLVELLGLVRLNLADGVEAFSERRACIQSLLEALSLVVIIFAAAGIMK